MYSICTRHALQLLEVLESGDIDELFEEDLGIEDSDVSGATDHRVCAGVERVKDVVANESRARTEHERLQQVRHHLRVHRTCTEDETGKDIRCDVMIDCLCLFTHGRGVFDSRATEFDSGGVKRNVSILR